MADISDVLSSLVALVTGIVFPNGASAPSIAGSCVQIMPGWPLPQQIDAAMKAGTSLVSVFPLRGKDTTRYLTEFDDLSVNVPTLTLTVSGLNVTVGGTVPPASNPTNVVIFVNSIPYIYQALVGDTLASIASALAALIPGAAASGTTVQVPALARLGAVRVGVTGQSSNIAQSELRRFQITVWAPTPALRGILGAAIRQYFAPISRIALPDGSQGNITFVDDFFSDTAQKQAVYRRDIWYSVDYPTLQTLTATQITDIATTAQRGDTNPPQQIFTAYQ